MQASYIDDAALNDRQIRQFTLACRLGATITYYRIPNTEWTAAEASARIDEARAWFDQYCIHLTFEEFALQQDRPADRRLQKDLDREVAQYNARVALVPSGAAPQREALLDDIQASVQSIVSELRKRVRRTRLIVLFLDEWYVLTGVGGNPQAWRQFRVSANDAGQLLIGIDRYDRKSTNILTHELIHGLRKRGTEISNGRCFREFARRNNIAPANLALRPWHDHYSGQNQDHAMNHVSRTGAFSELNLASNRVLSLDEYFGMIASPLLQSTAGCECWSDSRPEESGRDESR